MKGCAFNGTLSFLALLAAIAGVAGALRAVAGVPLTSSIGVAIFAGGLLWMAANLALSAVQASKERAAISGGLDGRPPVHGQSAVLVGTIKAQGTPLQTPFSNRPAVAYRFEVYEWRRTPGARTSTKVIYGDGIAQTPATIVTNSGSYDLLAVPELDCAPSELDLQGALARATELLPTLPFHPARKPFTRPEVEDLWNDDDGEFRRERRYLDDPPPINARVDERCIETGAQVTVFGPYDDTRRAIAADRNDWSKIVRIMKGDASAVAAQLRGSVIRRSVFAVLCVAAAGGLVTAFLSN